MTTPLAIAQREVARWVRAAEGVRAELESGGDDARAALDRLVRTDARLGAADRLEIYATAYFHRIHDVLAEEFEALAGVLGSAGFNDLVALYLLAHPSERPSLRWVGSRLAGFLADHPAAAVLRARWPWAPDLARLEWALSEAFDGPDAAALVREDLAAIAPDRFPDLVFSLHPTARRMSLDWPAHEWLRAAVDPSSSEAPVDPTPRPTTLVVWRRGEVPEHRLVSEREGRLLDALESGGSFGDLCALLAESEGDHAAAALMADALGGWVDRGLLASLPDAPSTLP